MADGVNVGDRVIAVIEGNWYELVDGVLMGGAVKVDGSLDGLDEPYEVMICDYQAVLCALLDAWCKKYSIAPASADDLLWYFLQAKGMEGDGWKAKVDWLEGYVKLWDEVVV
jgi:hypothetical protein